MSHQNSGPRDYVHKDLHNEVAEDLKRKVAELEGELKSERAEMELVRGRSRGDLHTLAELQAQLDRETMETSKLEEHTERCEDELDWWRKSHCDDRPPAYIWEGSSRGRVTNPRRVTRSAFLDDPGKVMDAAEGSKIIITDDDDNETAIVSVPTDTQQVYFEEPDRAAREAVLHPAGKCGCHGEGRCQFCLMCTAQLEAEELREELQHASARFGVASNLIMQLAEVLTSHDLDDADASTALAHASEYLMTEAAGPRLDPKPAEPRPMSEAPTVSLSVSTDARTGERVFTRLPTTSDDQDMNNG